jgi:hypothetical protein
MPPQNRLCYMPTILALKGEDFRSVTAWRIEAWQIVAGNTPIVLGWANEARDRSPAQIVLWQGVAPKLDPYHSVRAEFLYVIFARGGQVWRLVSGGLLPPFFPITEAAKVRRPLLFAHTGPKPRALNEKPPLGLRSATACRS